jgi:hypothetical protein
MLPEPSNIFNPSAVTVAVADIEPEDVLTLNASATTVPTAFIDPEPVFIIVPRDE